QFTNLKAAGSGGGGGGASTNTGVDVLAVAPVDTTLSSLLDLASAHWGVNYRYTSTGVIEIYRLETRILRLKALAQKVSTSIKTSAGFASESSISHDNLNADIISDVKNTLLALGTTAGSVDINLSTKTALIIDTPESIARMEEYLESENKRLSRRITLVVEQLFVTAKDEKAFAFDWNSLNSKLQGTSTAVFAGVGKLTGDNTTVGTLTTNIKGNGLLSGSKLVIDALSDAGLSVVSRSFPMSTLNGSATSVGLPTIFDYIASVQISQLATGGAGGVATLQPLVTVTQKDDKFGVFLTCTPEAQDNGEILVSYVISDRSGTLTPYSTLGSTVQQRNITEASLIARTVLRSGVTQMIGGLDESTETTKKRRIDDDAPIVLGGSNTTSQNKRRILILMTAVAEDGV
ncbi:MAG: hypothetical protein QM520_03785, partial [Gammaproteobacteria bacterium]|nr:hypothetical protein [Gammaproteobacteria bacterium]